MLYIMTDGLSCSERSLRMAVSKVDVFSQGYNKGEKAYVMENNLEMGI